MAINRSVNFLVLIGFVFFLSGCANQMSARVLPGTNLETLKNIHVVKLDADGRGIEKLIQARLEKMGISATAGSREEAPDNVDAIATYIDKWMWDINMYMIELTIVIRSPKSDFPLAQGNSMHTSLTRKSPEGMVEEVLTNIYNEG